jgi:zinc transport system substrate-binding protein
VRTAAALLTVLLLSSRSLPQEGPKLKVGVTLHPLYSWVANVVGKAPIEIVPVIGPAADVHHYQPSPEDLKKLSQLDLLFVNGLGHDDFIKGMIEASGNRKVKIVSPNAGLPLIPYQRGKSHTHGGEEKETAPRAAVAYNPHTFLTLTGAAQQVYTIEKELSLVAPEWTETFRANARSYARKLRELKAEASAKLSRAAVTRVATVHDGYAYLFQEFGIEIVAVIEPAHGVEPSAGELAKTIEAIKAVRTKVVFSELNFPPKLVDVIKKESGARVYTLDHMSSGESYSADRFEVSMRRNVETLVQALVTDAKEP